MTAPTDFLARFAAMDAALVAHGFPPTSPWWLAQLQRFYASGRRTFVLRVGRRGGKSSTLCRVAVATALWGSWLVPPGDVAVIAFVSVSRDESSQRLRTIEAILRALGIAYRRSGDSIDLVSRPVVFRTYAASISGVAGFTSVLFVGDELAKWRDSDTGVNPASDVLASARPTMATQPSARMFLCSSPFGTLDAHAAAFDAGDDDSQLVAHAPTWLANPSITEHQTRQLEPDEKIWRREYAAIPQDGLTAAFPSSLVDPAFRAPPPLREIRYPQPVLAIDASGGSSCEFASALAAWGWSPPAGDPIDFTWPLKDEFGNDVTGLYELDPARPGAVLRDGNGEAILRPGASRRASPTLYVARMDGLLNWGDHMSFDDVVGRLAAKAHAGGARVAVGDQYMGPALESAFKPYGIRYRSIPTTNASKNDAIKRLRLLLAGRQVVIGDASGLTRSQLIDYRERIGATGTVTYAAKAGSRADRVSVLVNFLTAESAGELGSWSPTWANTARRNAEPQSPLGRHMALNG
jgi:hypothetical protein